jgi:hypothetical protein
VKKVKLVPLTPTTKASPSSLPVLSNLGMTQNVAAPRLALPPLSPELSPRKARPRLKKLTLDRGEKL